jgi:hypothetical protein
MFQFPWCASAAAMDSLQGDRALPRPGFPIRTSPDRCLLTAPRGNIAVRRVLHRLLVPRHPPCALSSLTYRPCLKARTCISLKDVHSLSGFQRASQWWAYGPPGNVLLSRDPSVQVPSALEGLTVVFGMGTRGSPPLSSPDGLAIHFEGSLPQN